MLFFLLIMFLFHFFYYVFYALINFLILIFFFPPIVWIKIIFLKFSYFFSYLYSFNSRNYNVNNSLTSSYYLSLIFKKLTLNNFYNFYDFGSGDGTFLTLISSIIPNNCIGIESNLSFFHHFFLKLFSSKKLLFIKKNFLFQKFSTQPVIIYISWTCFSDYDVEVLNFFLESIPKYSLVIVTSFPISSSHFKCISSLKSVYQFPNQLYIHKKLS